MHISETKNRDKEERDSLIIFIPKINLQWCRFSKIKKKRDSKKTKNGIWLPKAKKFEEKIERIYI